MRERHGVQLGTLDAILRSSGRFLIRYEPDSTYKIALQVSRNLYQYFSADSELLVGHSSVDEESGNAISITIGETLPLLSMGSSFPIDIIEKQGLRVRGAGGESTIFSFQAGLGAIMLRPMPDERLELVVWGFDSLGLRLASRLLPMLTGTAQPDFTIVSERCGWMGAGGVLAMGFFDSHWNVTNTSFIT